MIAPNGAYGHQMGNGVGRRENPTLPNHTVKQNYFQIPTFLDISQTNSMSSLAKEINSKAETSIGNVALGESLPQRTGSPRQQEKCCYKLKTPQLYKEANYY